MGIREGLHDDAGNYGMFSMGEQGKDAHLTQRENFLDTNSCFYLFQEGMGRLCFFLVHAENEIDRAIFAGDLIYKFDIDSLFC